MLAKVASQMGYTELRPKQEEVISDFVRGSDVFVSLPTGSGKSVCYSLLPGVFNEVRHLLNLFVAIVVSPLIALRDEVRAKTERNVHASTLETLATAHQICAGLCSSAYTDSEKTSIRLSRLRKTQFTPSLLRNT